MISVNVGFTKNTLVLFKESIIGNQGKLDNKKFKNSKIWIKIFFVHQLGSEI